MISCVLPISAVVGLPPPLPDKSHGRPPVAAALSARVDSFRALSFLRNVGIDKSGKPLQRVSTPVNAGVESNEPATSVVAGSAVGFVPPVAPASRFCAATERLP